MKKLILLLVLAFVMCGCTRTYRVGEVSLGKKMAVPIEKGTTRITITEDYFIVETCTACSDDEIPYWKCDKIMNNDSIHREELIRRLKEN